MGEQSAGGHLAQTQLSIKFAVLDVCGSQHTKEGKSNRPEKITVT